MDPTFPTSTVSSALITPGCRNVRSFLTAFLAIGRRDLFAVTSKENMLQFDPSSCGIISVTCSLKRVCQNVRASFHYRESKCWCPHQLGRQMSMGMVGL